MTTSLRTELPRNANQLIISNSNIRSPEQADIVTLGAIMEESKALSLNRNSELVTPL
jgi:hypothetical protein